MLGYLSVNSWLLLHLHNEKGIIERINISQKICISKLYSLLLPYFAKIDSVRKTHHISYGIKPVDHAHSWYISYESAIY